MANHAEASPLARPVARGPLIVAWGVVATALSVLYTVVLGPFAALTATFGWMHAVTEISRWWAWLIIKTCGVTVEIEGLERVVGLKSFILVCNHQSFFDIFTICALMPGEFRFVAKKELLKIPVIGYALSHSDHIIIDRQAGGRQIRRAVEVSRKGYNIAVFAEGHRFNDNRVHEFEEGAAWLAILAKLPVVPVAISGSGAFFPRLARVVVPGGKMRIRIGEPISEDLRGSDRAQLTKRLESEVRAMFETEVR